MDPQVQLSRALESRNVESFKEALNIQANPNEPDKNGITIYEKALSTAGCGEFIKLCLQFGCKADYLNKRKKAAINFASDSRDSGNVRVLLEHPGVQVDNKYNDLTPLNSLAKNLDVSNASQVKDCMNLLLDYGASPNILDDSDMNPLLYVLSNNKIGKNQKHDIVDLLLKQPDIYLDEELRNELLEWNPDLKLKPNSNENSSIEVTSVHFIRLLHDGNDMEFQELLFNYRGDRSELIFECITNGRHVSFDCLLREQFDVNKKLESLDKTYVEISVVYGNWYALEKLLQHKDLKLANNLELLHQIIGRLDERPQISWSDYIKCFYVILNSERVNVNERDKSGRTALHYAIIYNHEFAVRELLSKGAYLGISSMFKELAIENIYPGLLEEHFNDCITWEGANRADKNFKIMLKYKTLKIPHDMVSSKSNEMEPICAMAKSKTLRHLLDHPLITTLISLKWKSISLLFYIYFAVSILFSISLIANIFVMFSHDVMPRTIVRIFQWLSWLSIVYFATSELFMIFITGLLWPMSRLMNMSLIVLSVMSNIVSNPQPEHYYSRIIAAFTILLIAVKVTRLIGSLPVFSLSMYVLMLREVCYTFLKSCIPYSILVISFGLSFYILNFHNLSEKSIADAIFKTIISSTGEFNENEIEFKKLFFDKLFFLIFVIFISIVLMNLLSALAFSDTQAIQALAKINSLICLVNLLSCYEICLTKPLGHIVNRYWVVKVANLPDWILAFPNKKHMRTVATKFCEMVPLMQGEDKQHTITIPEDQFNWELSNTTIRRIFQLIDQRSKVELNRQLSAETEAKLENIENILKQLVELAV